METDLEDRKLVKILEYFLSLHEADEIYNMIFNNKCTVYDIETKLDEYHNQID